MAFIIDSTLLEVLLASALILYLMYRRFSNHDYWKNRGVPCPKKSFFLQVLMGKLTQFELTRELYNSVGKEPYFGTFQFNQPTIFVRDPELIKKILVKDFIHFQDRPFPDVKRDAVNSSLFALKGEIWRGLRHKLTPTFTTGKLKGMFDQVTNCGNNLVKKIEGFSKENDDVEIKSFIFEFTSEVISSCAFGLQMKPGSPEFNEFRSKALKIFDTSILMILRFGLIVVFPRLATALNIRPFSREADDYFINLIKANMKYRKDNNIKRNDYFQLLLTLKEEEEIGKDMGLTMTETSDEDSVVNQMQFAGPDGQLPTSHAKLVTENVICANSFIFLLAGLESVSSTISMCLYELARHPVVQQSLQEEVDRVLATCGGWSYDAIRQMPYLDLVIQEAQRLYPVLPVLTRECVQPYKMPDTDLVIEKGVQVLIPVIGIHMDPQYYPDPETFKPERFVDNNFKQSSIYMPFGDGPRICIALRFAVMEVKTCVATIMSQYSVKLSPKTQLPLKFDPRSVFPKVKGGLWFTFEKRSLT